LVSKHKHEVTNPNNGDNKNDGDNNNDDGDNDGYNMVRRPY